jgi:crotonobetainyl-CoA:carnitine CoA-transferase CaiB-like acyl-CoA transferase
VVDPPDYDILAGVRVVELSSYAFGPAAGAVLAEWGADVVRVVRPTIGDPLMGNPIKGMDEAGIDVAYMWEILNRGKRAIGIELREPNGLAVFLDLIRSADVFLTSALPPARRKLGVDVADLRAFNPDVIYAVASANGPLGPERDVGGFDASSFWARSGLADANFVFAGDHVQPAMAMGDLDSGFNLAAGVVGALFRRERTGRTGEVDVSLLGSGVWLQSASIVAAGVYGLPRLPFGAPHRSQRNPLVAIYRCADDRYVAVASMAGEQGWTDFCRVAGRPDLADDPRFCSLAGRLAHNVECIAVLDVVFATRSQDDWLRLLEPTALPAGAVQTAAEVHTDPMVLANRYIRDVEAASGTTFATTATPVQFDGRPGQTRRAPTHGEQTDEILLELGYEWETITELKLQGAVL